MGLCSGNECHGLNDSPSQTLLFASNCWEETVRRATGTNGESSVDHSTVVSSTGIFFPGTWGCTMKSKHALPAVRRFTISRRRKLGSPWSTLAAGDSLQGRALYFTLFCGPSLKAL